MTERNSVLFYYQPAFFCSFEPRDPSSSAQPRIRIWTRHPASFQVPYDPTKSIVVDPAETPTKHSRWGDISMDDHSNSPYRGYTTIGPLFPHAYAAAGIYISRKELIQLYKIDSETSRNIYGDKTAIVLEDFDTKEIVRYHGYIGLQLHRATTTSRQLLRGIAHRGLLGQEGRAATSPSRIFLSDLWIVYHPGSTYENALRAPRKAMVPASSILDDAQQLVAFETEHVRNYQQGVRIYNNDIIYIEHDFAEYVAYLEVPKRPSGSGINLLSYKATATAESLPRPPYLNIISASPIGEIASIKQTLQGNYLEVGDTETLFDALSAYHADRKRENYSQFLSLDLIGHSRAGDMLLKLGEYTFTPKAAAEQFTRLEQSRILQDLGIRQIRLLGCRTGSTAHGRAVVEAIRKAMPSQMIYATRADLFANHYDQRGLTSDAEDLLIDQDVLDWSTPGDTPPADDYAIIPDDDDGPDTPPPNSFSIATLSDANAAIVSARSYMYWETFHTRFQDLCRYISTEIPIRDNPLLRADCEVLVSISLDTRTIDDIRSFDLILTSIPQRVRIYAGSTAYSFAFTTSDDVHQLLRGLGIGNESWKTLSQTHQQHNEAPR
jgi:hypothetical protein